MAYGLGEVVEVNRGEAEQVVAAEPADGRHSLPLASSAYGGWTESRRGWGGAAALYSDLDSCFLVGLWFLRWTAGMVRNGGEGACAE
jgi:hypothetical protein